MVVSGSPKMAVGGILVHPPIVWLKKITTYLPLIVLAECGGVKNATDPTF